MLTLRLAFLSFAIVASPQIVSAQSTFGGFYGGGALGYGFNGTSQITDEDSGSIYDFDIKGNQISLIAGYNFQANGFVFGIEGDANFGSIKDAQTVVQGPFSFAGKAEAGTYYSLRARLGFTPSENLLLFGTAGPAWGTLSTSTIITAPTVLGPLSPFTSVNEEKSVDGYVLGLGGEYQLGERARFRLEYSELYYNGVKFTQKFPGVADDPFTTDNAASFVRTGVTFKF
jgi:outer membrane immunogenic protein